MIAVASAVSPLYIRQIRIFVTAFALLIMVLAAMPIHAKAASLTESQIEAVTNLLASFDVEERVILHIKATLGGKVPEEFKRNVATSSPKLPIVRGICPAFVAQLKRGSSGEDVSKLQTFLAEEGAVELKDKITGYFGPLTEEAVKKFQARMNIVSSGDAASTGYGVVGEKTRELIRLRCGNIDKPDVVRPAPSKPKDNGGMYVCTADAMMCPDGTYVGRSGPNCEFKCPTTSE